MTAAPQVVRALDPAERYFWLLSQVSSVNAVLCAYVDRTFEEAELAVGLRALQRRHPLLRVRIEVVDGELAFVRASGEIPVTIMAPRAPGEPVPVARLQMYPFPDPPHPLVHCFSLPTVGSDASVIMLLVHHAFFDGSAAMRLLQEFLRALDGDDEALYASDDVPPPVHDRFPEALRSPKAVVNVLGAVRGEREGQPKPSEFPFHARLERDRLARHDLLSIEGDALKELLAQAKAQGASVTGLVGARMLQAGAALFDDDDPRLLWFASATDLRPRVEPPLPVDDVQLAIGMLCTPYLVSAETTDTLARTIGDQIEREVDRGESHLFYRIARVGTYPPTPAGVESFRKWVDSSPQNITVSSLGLIRDDGDPSWVRRLTASMYPGPNQLTFTSTTTYRGELVVNVATDAAKLPADVADRFVAEIAARMGARLEQTTTFGHDDEAVPGVPG